MAAWTKRVNVNFSLMLGSSLKVCVEFFAFLFLLGISDLPIRWICNYKLIACFTKLTYHCKDPWCYLNIASISLATIFTMSSSASALCSLLCFVAITNHHPFAKLSARELWYHACSSRQGLTLHSPRTLLYSSPLLCNQRTKHSCDFSSCWQEKFQHII